MNDSTQRLRLSREKPSTQQRIVGWCDSIRKIWNQLTNWIKKWCDLLIQTSKDIDDADLFVVEVTCPRSGHDAMLIVEATEIINNDTNMGESSDSSNDAERYEVMFLCEKCGYSFSSEVVDDLEVGPVALALKVASEHDIIVKVG